MPQRTCRRPTPAALPPRAAPAAAASPSCAAERGGRRAWRQPGRGAATFPKADPSRIIARRTRCHDSLPGGVRHRRGPAAGRSRAGPLASPAPLPALAGAAPEWRQAGRRCRSISRPQGHSPQLLPSLRAQQLRPPGTRHPLRWRRPLAAMTGLAGCYRGALMQRHSSSRTRRRGRLRRYATNASTLMSEHCLHECQPGAQVAPMRPVQCSDLSQLMPPSAAAASLTPAGSGAGGV